MIDHMIPILATYRHSTRFDCQKEGESAWRLSVKRQGISQENLLLIVKGICEQR